MYKRKTTTVADFYHHGGNGPTTAGGAVLCIFIRGVTISQTEPKDRDTPPTIRIAELSWRTAVLSRPLLPIAEVNGTYL